MEELTFQEMMAVKLGLITRIQECDKQLRDSGWDDAMQNRWQKNLELAKAAMLKLEPNFNFKNII